ncbi:hypothetical protein ACTXT7_011911 [Hymenolepis weldensis]
MDYRDDASIISRKSEKLGDIEKLSVEAVRCPEMYKKVKKTLKLVNSTRSVPLKLVEIVSADRQIVNGVKENIIVRLRESGSKHILEYNLYIYEKADDKKNVEIRLTLRKPK